MNDILKKIYNEILVYEKDIATTNQKADKAICKLLKTYQKNLTDDEYEKIKELVFSITSIAEQAGFENGIRFTIKLIYSLFKD